ncbi:hypothetical protein IX339_000985 [Porphyromonas levii]|nr:hypothetical protein [Porphyromonas levii]
MRAIDLKNGLFLTLTYRKTLKKQMENHTGGLLSGEGIITFRAGTHCQTFLQTSYLHVFMIQTVSILEKT